jgi:beta-lactamase regulating signal transducer with metallopeptidase domain
MPVLFNYILKLSLSLGVIFIFYHLVLRKLTFYSWNRWFLLGYTLICFFIPFVDISAVLKKNNWADATIIEWMPVVGQFAENTPQPDTQGISGGLDPWMFIKWFLLAGIFIMFVRLLVQLYSMNRMIRKAKLISDAETRIYRVDDRIIPFSFGNSIFINPSLHNENEIREIIRHEFVHVRQGHTVDIIWSEILCLLNWYNPFAWLLKASIRQNLEFIADQKVLENGLNKKEYQYLLLKVIGNQQFSIASSFNFSSLKKRIAMMNKLKSARLNLVRFLFVLPLAAVLLLAFRQQDDREAPYDTIPGTGQAASTSDHSMLQKDFINATLVRDTPPVTNKERLGRNVENFEAYDNKVVIRLKNGDVEEYNLKNPEQLKKFEDRYGKIVKVDAITGAPVQGVTVFGVNSNLNTNLNTNVVQGTRISTTAEQSTLVNGVNIIATKIAHANNLSKQVVIAEGNRLVSTIAPSPISVNGEPLGITTAEVAHAMTPSTTILNPAVSGSLIPTVSGSGLATTSTYLPSITQAGQGLTILDGEGNTHLGKEEIVITITKYSTRQQLGEFQKQMKAKGVDLDFTDIEYSDKGTITFIKGTMTSGESRGNFVGSDFEKLIISVIRFEDKLYFKIAVKEKELI